MRVRKRLFSFMAPASFLEFLWDFIPPNKQQLFMERVKERTRFLTVVLEDIYQPHNASAVMRSCDCFGVQDIHIIENRNRWEYSPDVERGSSKWLSISRYNSGENNSAACIEALKAKGYEVVATTPRTDCTLESFRPQKPIALIIGTEKKGISEGILSRADQLIKIPMVGFTESLNLSVAAAICIHHIKNRLKESSLNWHLREEQQEEILLEWCKKMIKSHELYFKRFSELPKG